MLLFEFVLPFRVGDALVAAASHLMGVVDAAFRTKSAEFALIEAASLHAVAALAADPAVFLAAVDAVLTAVMAAIYVLIALQALQAVVISVLTVSAESAVFAQILTERLGACPAVLAEPSVLLAAVAAVLTAVMAGIDLAQTLLTERTVIAVVERTLLAELTALAELQVLAEKALTAFRAAVVLVALKAVPAALSHVVHKVALVVPDHAVLAVGTYEGGIGVETISAQPAPLVDDHIAAAVGASPALHAHGDALVGETCLPAGFAVDGVIQGHRAFQTYLADVAPSCYHTAVHASVAVLAVFAVVYPLFALGTHMSRMHVNVRKLLKCYDHYQQ